MFLRSTNRRKDGKDHRYFSIVENRRLPGGKTAQRTVLYLGEINDQQQVAWRKTLDVNLTGLFLTCRAAVPHMLKNGKGKMKGYKDKLSDADVKALVAYVRSLKK